MIDVAAIQSGLGAWAKGALGLADAQILWSGQNAGEPAAGVATWLSLRMGNFRPLTSYEGVRHYRTPGTPAAGEEVTLETGGLRDFTFGLQLVTRNALVGNDWAVAQLSRLLTRLDLPTSRAAFAALGLSIHTKGDVRNLSGYNAQRVEGRALLELGLYVKDSETEKVGYIETVSGTIVLDGDTDNAIPFAAEVPTPE